MGWFKKKKVPLIDPERDAEMAKRKTAVQEAGGEAVGAADKLNRVIGNDSITVIIAAAMGAQHQEREVRQNGH
jgi:hypothetical protein